MSRLTKPQQRLLDRVRLAGELRQNGRARRTVEALAAAGLVEYDFELVPQARGSGVSFTEGFIVRERTGGAE